MGNSSFVEGHSALSDKSAIEPIDYGDRPCVLSPRASAQNALFSSQILECLAESSPKDSHSISESRVADSKIPLESTPHANLESKADSESTSGGVYLHRDKNKNAHSRNLKGVVGVGGLSRGEGASLLNLQVWISPAASSSPSPLDKKEKEILKNSEILEVKTADSKAIVSESENQAESTKTLDSEKVDSESKRLTNRDISGFRPQYDKGLESYPHANLESNTDSELTPAVGHCPTAIESHSGERCSLE